MLSEISKSKRFSDAFASRCISKSLTLGKNAASSSIKSIGVRVNSTQYEFLVHPFEGLGRIKYNKQKVPSKGPQQKQIALACLKLY